MAALVTGSGHRALLDQFADPHLCLDIHSWRKRDSDITGFIGFEGIRLINTPFAVVVGIIYGYLPLMVFPIYVSLENLDKDCWRHPTILAARRSALFFR